MVGKILGEMLAIKQINLCYRVRTKHGMVDVTEDHILLDKNREIVQPCDLVLGKRIIT